MKLSQLRRRRPTGDLARSLTLMRIFLIAAAAMLVAGGAVLGLVVTRSIEGQAVSDRKQSLARYAEGILRPIIVRDGRVSVREREADLLAKELKRERDIVSVKVWRQDGTLVWTNAGRERIGRQFKVEGDLAEVLRTNRPQGSLGSMGDEDEDALEKQLSPGRQLEVYAPIRSDDGRRAIGAYEVYADAAPLESFVASQKTVIWLTIGGVFAALYAVLAVFVRTASSTMRRQTVKLRKRSEALLESYQRLEQNALEAIESLNATVEAKDTDTAGHSRRVQAIALAIGEELGLSPTQLDAIRFGALFHDIGKISVPDGVLGRPGPLSPEEFEHFKRHVVEGSRIVEKFGRLRNAVPVIRHHHERWDGTGYPDRLAGEEIPVEATIVGFADAWDAMTTDRPYARALTTAEALAEVRAGRGTHFSPSVVDTFFALVRRRPGTLKLAEQFVAEQPAAVRATGR